MLDTNVLISSLLFPSESMNAMIEDVDILITGDKDFEEIEIEKPEIMSPSEYIDKYLYGNLIN